MATINGIAIKGLKYFRDHEGMEIAQGNLYVENKKIGFWSMDSWGGPDIISLDDKYSEAKLRQCIKDKAGTDIDIALWRLLNLKDYEDLWKRNGKRRLFIATDTFHIVSLPVGDDAKVEDILKRDDVKECIEKSFFHGSAHEYLILDETSFDEGEPITLAEIRR